MKIGGVDGRPLRPEALSETRKADRVGGRGGGEAARPAYKVCFGEEAQLALKAFAIVHEASDVRTAKVERAIRAIEHGTYRVNSADIAIRILE
ncbi:MAG: flagellar biosynthesis anti-sigma factor FlgM [Armatimonadetes bacterium]|nr:flagellar biosynthesis anti-sigma factor FlgM [Armatimonadota bacterium]